VQVSLAVNSIHACRFNLHRRPLLVIFQGWDLHQGPFRVGAMHGLAVVSQRFLREAFRVAIGFGAFSPRISEGCCC